MRIVVAPDRFTGSLTAAQVADALTTGWKRWQPGDELSAVPLSDGGAGFAAIVGAASADGTLVLDSGAIDEGGDSTELGLAIADAVSRHPRRLVVGIAGGLDRAPGDGGLGVLRAMGAEFTGRHLDVTGVRERLAGIDLVIATDVDDAADSVPSWLSPEIGAASAGAPGAGALRGVGLAFLAVGARRVNASQYAIDATGLQASIAGPPVADLVITGEATLGPNSKRGRVVAGVARVAAASGSPVIAFCSSLEFGRRELANLGLEAAYPLERGGPSIAEASTVVGGEAAAERLADVAERVARTWSPRW